ncbi:MAG: TlpA disulfide reductase family protein [Sandaracinaceae bacterium]
MSDPAPLSARLRVAWPWFLLAGALTLWVFVGHGGERLPEGDPAPALHLPSSEGELDLAAEQGRVVVLAFWATWCSACRAEGPVLSRVHERLAAQGDGVVGVSVDTIPLERVVSAARGFGMTYPIALGTRADAERFSVSLLPTIYVIAPDGRIAESFTGGASESTILEAVARARAVSARPAPRRSPPERPRTAALP